MGMHPPARIMRSGIIRARRVRRAQRACRRAGGTRGARATGQQPRIMRGRRTREAAAQRARGPHVTTCAKSQDGAQFRARSVRERNRANSAEKYRLLRTALGFVVVPWQAPPPSG